MQKDYPTFAEMGSRCMVVFLHFLVPAWWPERRPPSFLSRWCSEFSHPWLVSVLSIRPSLLEMKHFSENFFFHFPFFLGGL